MCGLIELARTDVINVATRIARGGVKRVGGGVGTPIRTPYPVDSREYAAGSLSTCFLPYSAIHGLINTARIYDKL